ncbi:MAG: FHA domain-containing protein [Myxococcales bacterium]|nr:FHA domain-containing protein [Myxococcales bacterium]MCB9576456.1 FHA domain-containing protein [Polyangiaceae bacterium]
MGVLSKALGLFRGRGGGGPERRARRAEARGELAEAAAAYLEAGLGSEAARVFAARADAAAEPRERYQLLGQALSLASAEQKAELSKRRGELALDLLKAGTLQLTPRELSLLGRELERAGSSAAAAEAYGLAGDVDDQARMLVDAGAIERLEQVLGDEQKRERKLRERAEVGRKAKDLFSCGRRREALALARAPRAEPDDMLLALAVEIEERRAQGPSARFELDGRPLEVAFGDSVVIGRADADITVPSPGISRQHLVLRRTPSGPEAADLGSSNGTLLRGVRLDVPVAIGEGIELTLGGDVSAKLTPLDGGGVRVEIGARVVLAPLGPWHLDDWRVQPADDGWLELSAHTPGYLEGLQVDQRIQLCRGDALSNAAGAPPRLRVVP